MHHSSDNQKDCIELIEQFLPQLSSPFEACKFMTQNLAYNEMFLLRSKMGPLFRVITGNACGFYVIDLGNETDVKLLKRLNEINGFEKIAIKSAVRNTSQHGDLENFRNEKLNGKSLRLNSKFFYSIPTAGVLEFDFVSTSRPVQGVSEINETQFKSMSMMIFGPLYQQAHLDISQKNESQAKNSSYISSQRFHRRASRRMSTVDESIIFNPEVYKRLWTHINETSWHTLKERYSDNLYAKIEEAKAENPRFQDDPGAAFRSAIYTKVFKDARNEPIHKIHRATKPPSVAEDDRGRNTSTPQSRGGRDRFTIAAAGRKAATNSKATRDLLALQCAIFESALQKLEVYLCYNVWFTCEQLLELIDKFLDRQAPTSVIARLVSTLFSRIIDLENMGHVLNAVDHEIKLEVTHRLGIFNVWCLMVPDGKVELDLAAWDHREACKLLIRLAIIEPGNIYLN
jgi:hypothetical protein